jgi:selenocysteine lyase/cysteine desulfurase
VGRLVGGAARNIAIVENATVAFAQALSAFDFEAGDMILTTHNDYVSNRSCTGRSRGGSVSRSSTRRTCRRAAWIRSPCAI